MKPAGTLGPEVAVTRIAISRGGHGPCLAGEVSLVMPGACTPSWTVLSRGRVRTGHHAIRMAVRLPATAVRPPPSSVSIPLSHPRWTSSRVRRWGQERGCSTPTSLMGSPPPPASFLRPYGCREGAWAGSLLHIVHTGWSNGLQTLVVQITI